MFTLIALGTLSAWSFSVLATLLPDVLPESFRGAGGAPPLYFEASAVIVTLVLLGQVLELRARSRTSGAIRALLKLAPKIAHRLDGRGAEPTWRSRTWRSAIGCVCVPARRFRSTAS